MIEEDCAELLWKGLDGCPSCDTGNCVVLATIENYHLDDKLTDQTDPPADPAADLAAHIARIDNRNGRQLLPSTQVLTNVVQCLLEHAGGDGQQGPPGPTGPPVPKGLPAHPDPQDLLVQRAPLVPKDRKVHRVQAPLETSSSIHQVREIILS